MSLIDSNLDIVFMRAKQIAGHEWRDYLTSGYVGLHDAASKFRPDGGASFRAYAYTRVTGAILDQRRVDAGSRNSRKKKIKHKHVSPDDFVCVKAAPCPVEAGDTIRAIVAPLPPRTAMVARMLADGFLDREIADAIGYSRSQVRIERVRIAARMKDVADG